VTAAPRPYSRVYHEIVEHPRFERVYRNPSALGTWLQMLLTADASGWRTSWGFDGGRRKEPFGLPHPTARAAADVAGRINARGQDFGVAR